MTDPSPSDQAEKHARRIIKLLRDANIGADEICTAGALNADFIKAGGEVADYEAGMTFAIVNGWVADEGEMIRLLSAGANQGS
jgi:hypothetical protein